MQGKNHTSVLLRINVITQEKFVPPNHPTKGSACKFGTFMAKYG
jgi:hypothetical protein